MDKQFRVIILCDNLSVMGLEFNHIDKRGSRDAFIIAAMIWTNSNPVKLVDIVVIKYFVMKKVQTFVKTEKEGTPLQVLKILYYIYHRSR